VSTSTQAKCIHRSSRNSITIGCSAPVTSSMTRETMEHLTLAQTLAADDEPILWSGNADAKASLEAQRARLRRLVCSPYPWAAPQA
jgi:hypothetical protein